jgi:hypothetical protein
VSVGQVLERSQPLGREHGAVAGVDPRSCGDGERLEGLVNLAQLPARGALVVVGALPLVGGSGAPGRVFGLVPEAAGQGPGRVGLGKGEVG